MINKKIIINITYCILCIHIFAACSSQDEGAVNTEPGNNYCYQLWMSGEFCFSMVGHDGYRFVSGDRWDREDTIFTINKLSTNEMVVKVTVQDNINRRFTSYGTYLNDKLLINKIISRVKILVNHLSKNLNRNNATEDGKTIVFEARDNEHESLSIYKIRKDIRKEISNLFFKIIEGKSI